MRGAGQIAELVAIAEPDVGLIVNVGPVHLELLGTVERVAAAKAELIRDLRRRRHRRRARAASRCSSRTCATTSRRSPSAPGGDVSLALFDGGHATIDARGDAGRARAPVQRAAQPAQHGRRGGRRDRARASSRAAPWTSASRRCAARWWSSGGGVTVVNDCYNANPMSMRAALEHLAATPADRRIAVLGTMAELGDDGERFHREIGALADELGHRRADHGRRGRAPDRGGLRRREARRRHRPRRPARCSRSWPQPGDRVLVKGSRSAGLERVPRTRHARRDPHRGHRLAAALHVPRAEVHRVPAREGVRPAHPRGGARGAPRQGRHADDGRPRSSACRWPCRS